MKIEQFSLFKSDEKKSDPAPLVAKKTKPFFNVTLAIGSDPVVRQNEGMLTLRILGNRYVKNIGQKESARKLLANLKQEIKIKKGILPLPAAIQNALLISENANV